MSIQNTLLKQNSWTQPIATVPTSIHYRTQQTFKHIDSTKWLQEGVGNMKRILIIGSSGSGKSTLARRLGATLELPVIHLDRHYWHPGWVGTPQAEWQRKTEELVQREEWIIDGNYRGTLETRLAAADSVVFLDLPPWMCALRALKRRIEYRNRPRPDIADGCMEPLLDPQLFQFMRHVLSYPDRAKPYVMKQLTEIADEKRIILLKSTRDVNNFLNSPLNFPALNLNHTPRLQKEPKIVQISTK
jgi:adenylate kinase family enzyme